MSSGDRERGAALRRVGALFEAGTVAGLTDAELLERFAARGTTGEGSEAAFAALVERHGPTVLRLCRRVLDDPSDAEDAFQATFLVLVRRAGAIRRRESVGSWLHGVALRVASASRASSARRRMHERRKAEMASAAAGDGAGGSEVAPLVHEELGRLPERFRAAVVLCDLEGLTYDEAADRLRWPVGTVKSRLSRGRARLRARLTRLGLSPASGAGLFPAPGARRPVPPALLDATVRAARAFAAGQSATKAVIPAAVATLTEGVLKVMFLTKLKTAAALTAAGLLALGSGVAARPSSGDGADVGSSPEARLARVETALDRVLKAVDASGPGRIVLPADGAKPGGEEPGPGAAAVPIEAVRPPAARLKLGYVVEPPDLIRVDVPGALAGRPISGERLVRPDGRISLGFYGEVYVAGLTTDETREKITIHLRQFLDDEALGLVETDPASGKRLREIKPRDSQGIRVEVSGYNSKFYHVEGAVEKPGKYPVIYDVTSLDRLRFLVDQPTPGRLEVYETTPGRPNADGPLTVLDALNLAGLTPAADKRNILLIRKMAPWEGPEDAVLSVDLERIVSRGDPRTNYPIMAGDRLLVGRDPNAPPEPDKVADVDLKAVAVPVRDPAPDGAPVVLDPPTGDEAWAKVKEMGKGPKGEAKVRGVTVEKVGGRVDACKIYPLAGPCRLVHAHYKVTVRFDDETSSDAPIPYRHVTKREEVAYLDKDVLVRCKDPDHREARHGGQPDFDRRLSEVERKLDRVLKALEAKRP